MDHKYYNLYTLNNQFIKKIENTDYEIEKIYEQFTGILETPCKKRVYFENGKYHRLGGPAFIMTPDSKGGNYYIHGKQYTKEQYTLLVDTMKLKELL